MARRDAYHDIVRTALEKDGWTITDDPLRFEVEEVRISIDLGVANEHLAAERDRRKIAVEIKSFVGASALNEFEKAIGQYLLYALILSEEEADRKLYLAIPESAYSGVFSYRIVSALVENLEIRLLVFNELEERVIRWIDERNIRRL